MKLQIPLNEISSFLEHYVAFCEQEAKDGRFNCFKNVCLNHPLPTGFSHNWIKRAQKDTDNIISTTFCTLKIC